MIQGEPRNKGEMMRKQIMEEIQKGTPTRFIAKHTVAADETLSHIALKYYQHATKPYYMLIYEANKKAIGDNPNLVKPGLVLDIPELPEELKDK